MRPLAFVLLLWLSLAPLGYGLLVQAGQVQERWPLAEALAARFGPAGGLLPYACGSLLLAAPLLWWPRGRSAPGRDAARPGHEERS